MTNNNHCKQCGTSLIEILIILSIIGCVFSANIVILLHTIIRVKQLDKAIESSLQDESKYELSQHDKS